MKKSRFLWMLDNEKDRISNDRMLRFRQARKELTVDRLITDDPFYRDTALIPGDIICVKFKDKDSMCIVGKAVKFQYPNSSKKKDKRFPYKYLILETNTDIAIRVSPCFVIDKKRRIKACPLKFINVNNYVCSVKPGAIDFSKQNVKPQRFQILKEKYFP